MHFRSFNLIIENPRAIEEQNAFTFKKAAPLQAHISATQ
jgi:hypothetical protein